MNMGRDSSKRKTGSERLCFHFPQGLPGLDVLGLRGLHPILLNGRNHTIALDSDANLNYSFHSCKVLRFVVFQRSTVERVRSTPQVSAMCQSFPLSSIEALLFQFC